LAAPAAALLSARSARADPHSAAFRGDTEDPQQAHEYAADMFGVFFQEEATKMPEPNYLAAQPDINAKMRGILVDWLVEVHSKYKMHNETLYLTVNIIDRYLSLRTIKRRHLQLLGVVALFIASKYEEIDPPKAAALAHITDNAYTKAEILRLECNVVAALNFEIVAVTPAHFVDRFARVNACQPGHRSFINYLLDLCLPEAHMIRHTPSQLVSAAILLSNQLLGHAPAWSAAMAHHSRHHEVVLEPIAREMQGLLERAPTNSLKAVREKYQQEGHHCVADFGLRA